MVLNGIDVQIRDGFRELRGKSVGLLVNQASVDRELVPTIDRVIAEKGLSVKALFGPQHGIAGTTQDNMIEWQSFTDGRAQLPVYSLYGEVRKPTPKMLDGIEILVVDLPDVGARYYTFLWTAYLALQACAEGGITMLFLDRPNPLNGETLEGPCLDGNYRSFVGLYPLIIRHGMTMGEILTLIAARESLSGSLKVVKMEGWKRGLFFDACSLPWVLPSPNMPTLDTALVYPGFCLLEGTMLSEGRGTTRPFELFGAPYIESYDLVREISREHLPGVHFRPASFIPTFQKFGGQICNGAQLHITDRTLFRSVKTVVAVLKVIRRMYGERFAWKEPPYEYEYHKLPFDILAGGEGLRHHIERDTPLSEIEDEWRSDEDAFMAGRKEFLLYRS
jgi:uncharacterized protein YbbC (DUF1343 family)